MAYFLRIHKRPKGLYLQIDESFRNKEKKRTDHRSYKSLGYVDDLVASGIDNPISFYKNEVEKLNLERKEQLDYLRNMKIDKFPASKNLGHFLVKAMLDKLEIDSFIDTLGESYPLDIKNSQLIRTLIYARIIRLSHKKRTMENIFPILFNCPKFSIDQVYDAIKYIGNDYKKYIDLFNNQVKKRYDTNNDTVFISFSNYFFGNEFFNENEQKRKSHSLSQFLILDNDQIPIAMEMLPFNKPKKTHINKYINDFKTKHNIKGKIVNVANKGLNIAQSIYEATNNDYGYLFSIPINNKNISEIEKRWILDSNNYINIKDKQGDIFLKIKECVDEFTYYIIDENGDKISFNVKEKRVISYNPSLAKKQRSDIKKFIEKTAHDYNIEKINEDLELCGYNLIVTSEKNKPAKEIYDIYNRTIGFEESFRITQSYLDDLPTLLKNKEAIYGYFLICYLSLVIFRLLELKVLNFNYNSYDILDFIRSYNFIEGPNNIFINNAKQTNILNDIKSIFNLDIIDNAFLTKNDIEKIYSVKL